MNKDSKIYVAGHNGLVGSAILRDLEKKGFRNIIYKSHSELDLTNQNQVFDFFQKEKPEFVFVSAGKVGGIWANMNAPADFYYINSMIANNVIHAAYTHKVTKLLYLGSSCIYPANATQPIKEDSLLSGLLEPTNEAYGLAKISGLKMCDYYRKQYGCDFISAMPTSLYGPNDNFDYEKSHLLPALLRKFHDGKVNNSSEVIVWGTGKPYRELMYVDDLADALLFLMENYSDFKHVNVGTGVDNTINEITNIIQNVVGFNGKIQHDLSKPDGMYRKLLDVSKLHNIGWKHKIELKEGVEKTYKWFLENYKE